MSRIADHEAALRIDHETVRPGEPTGKLRKNLRLRAQRLRIEQDAPDLRGARQRREGVGCSSRLTATPFGEAALAGSAGRCGRRAWPIKPTGWIMHTGLALVGEKHRSVGKHTEIVEALEAFAVDGGEQNLDAAIARINPDKTAFVIRNQQLPVGQDFHAVRPAVVFGDNLEVACGVDREYASVRNVDRPVAGAFTQALSLGEAVDGSAAFCWRRPMRCGSGLRSVSRAGARRPCSRSPSAAQRSQLSCAIQPASVGC